MIKEGKIKKQKPLPEITEDEIPFEIPESWEWVRVGRVFNLQAGKNKTSIEIGEVQTDILQYPCYGGNGKRGYVKDYNRDGVYALIGRQGALCGNINIASGKFYATEHAVVVEHFCSIDVRWSGYFLRALNLNQYATATAQPGLSVANINRVLIPIPPIAEQKRIVAKIEELMPFVEQYAAASTKLNTLNATFPEMMKKSILQEAVQGKLVPQDPNDEPASVLLKKIAEEKKRLIKEGKFKKQKPLPEIMEDEIPFDIPNSWEWVRLGDLISIKSGEGLTSSNMKEGAIPVYGGNGITGFHNEALVHEETVVIGRVGYYCGSVHVTESEAWVTDNAFITTYPYECLNREYLVFVLRHMNLGKDNNATAQPVVSGKKIYPKLFPLPPLSEQKRIANKIKGLLSQVVKLVQ